MGTVLGIDYGRRRLGIALADEETRLALPRKPLTVRNTEEALRQIEALVRAQGVERIVVGLPLTLLGTQGMQAREAQEFAKALEKRMGIPVDVEDERLTTKGAQAAYHAHQESLPPDREDSAAAAALLQSYLDRRRL